MDVTFLIQSSEGDLSEADALASLTTSPTRSEEPYLFGWLILKWDDFAELRLNDDLAMLLPRCRALLEALRTQGSAKLIMASYYCHYSFVVDGEMVSVLQDDRENRGVEVARFPKSELIEALATCCQRFTLYSQQLAELDPGRAGIFKAMTR